MPTFATYKNGEFINQVQSNKFESLKNLVDKENLLHTDEVQESFCEHRFATDQDLDVIGELLTNIFWAIEVPNMWEKQGKLQSEVLNAFSKKALGSIDPS